MAVPPAFRNPKQTPLARLFVTYSLPYPRCFPRVCQGSVPRYLLPIGLTIPGALELTV